MSSNIKVQRICEHCGNEFTARTTATRCCSHKCSSAAYKARKRATQVEQTNAATQQMKLTGKIYTYNIKDKEVLNVREAAYLLGCSLRTMYRFIEDGEIKSVNLSQRMTRIKRVELDKILEARISYEVKPKIYTVPECYSMTEVQETYGISAKALYDMINRNKIPKLKCGKYSYVPRELIDELLN